MVWFGDRGEALARDAQRDAGSEPGRNRTCKVQGCGTGETTLVALRDDDCSPSLTGARPAARRGHSRDLLCPPHIVPRVKAEPQKSAKAEEPKTAGDLDQESGLLYADLDHAALRRPCRLSPVVPADSSTIYAVVV